MITMSYHVLTALLNIYKNVSYLLVICFSQCELQIIRIGVKEPGGAIGHAGYQFQF